MERARASKRTLDDPDERRRFERIELEFVRLGDLSVVRSTSQPGWRWSTDVKPVAGTERCMVHHRGTVISGVLGIEMADGSTLELTPGDVYEVPPGHDGWVIGDEPVVLVEMSALMSEFGQPRGGERILATLLFTDVVGSTPLVQRLGDAEWKRLISAHDVLVRNEVERFRGRVVSTTGDGVFARLDGAARGLMSALAIRDAADRLGLPIRTGVHTGEVELDGDGLRGLAIHEASRIMSLAGADEILVSELTVQLATGSGLTFEERGEVELRGVSGKRNLYALTGRS